MVSQVMAVVFAFLFVGVLSTAGQVFYGFWLVVAGCAVLQRRYSGRHRA